MRQLPELAVELWETGARPSPGEMQHSLLTPP